MKLFNRDSAVGHSFADRTVLVMLLAAFGVIFTAYEMVCLNGAQGKLASAYYYDR